MKLNSIFQPYEPLDIYTYFNHCGIIDVKEYLKPKNKYVCDPMGFAHIREAINLYKYHLLGHDSIGILVDSDSDGWTSASLVYKYTKRYYAGIKVKFYLHDGKERGLDDDKVYNQIMEDKPNLLIIPDAGSMKTGKEQILINNGIDLLVLDHHNADLNDYIDCGVLINNQLEENVDIDKNLSGCGVTYKFLKAMDIELGIKYADRFIDLVGLSVLSDSMPLNDYENRYYVEQLLKNDDINNKFLKELIYQYADKPRLTIRDISWSIIPKINSVIRSDDLKMKQNVLRAMCEIKGTDYEAVAVKCGEFHKAQREYVENFIKKNMDKAVIGKNIIILLSNEIKRSYSGLVAGSISGRYNNKPTIVGKTDSTDAIGSFRGVGIDRSTLQSIDGFNWCRGHDTGAFGISMIPDKEHEIVEYIDTLNIDYTPVEDVLQILPISSIPTTLYSQFDTLNGIIGEGLITTNFGITDIKVKPKDIKVLKNNTVKITVNKVDIMFFKMSATKLKKDFGIILDEDGTVNYTDNEEINLTVVGQLSNNTWRGKTTHQIIVDKYETRKAEDCFD